MIKRLQVQIWLEALFCTATSVYTLVLFLLEPKFVKVKANFLIIESEVQMIFKGLK
ncbi:hypothetical protein DEAC_c04400 [Desulfosporosinus acididurans]|uniref:Uncharacterized protein n=1 Tax=Desulfosporosinus acididurans TaxID=476652 RepID=A0A0J1FW58_9FIRM|nr:hypothetical protein DEAC_c04400 [Desulfosporosinus acididurans]